VGGWVGTYHTRGRSHGRRIVNGRILKLSKPFQNTRIGGGWWVCDPGRWWVLGGWVGSHTTRGRSYGSGSDCHVAHMTRVNLSLVEVKFEPTWHATWQKTTRVIT
jgi:hypothetical protein